MHDEEQRHTWHEKRWVRITGLLVLPAIILGLYLITTWWAARKPVTVPESEEEVSLSVPKSIQSSDFC
ncbi:MAG: hypothetical protein ACOC0N_09520 [Chroococcales cyanobacterium]